MFHVRFGRFQWLCYASHAKGRLYFVSVYVCVCVVGVVLCHFHVHVLFVLAFIVESWPLLGLLTREQEGVCVVEFECELWTSGCTWCAARNAALRSCFQTLSMRADRR